MDPLTRWAMAEVGAPTAQQTPNYFPRVPKSAVLYLHVLPNDRRLRHARPGYQTQYQCMDCSMWISDLDRCTIHGQEDIVVASMSCGYWVPGMPTSSGEGSEPHGNVTAEQSGLTDNPVGFSCKRCARYVAQVKADGTLGESGGCNAVDFNSPGDDPGMIHPDACCAGWKRDPDVGDLETGGFLREGDLDGEIA